MQHCAGPVALPQGALTQRQAETLWARDRTSLVMCADNLRAVTDYYADLSVRLAGR